MTGAGVVIAEVDAAEVERRTGTFAAELHASGDVGMALVRRAALNSVRMERGADQQTAALTEKVRQAEAEFEAPEGVDEAEAAQLRAEAGRRAMFDPSKEACLARQYEAAAERAFFRCLKELDKMARTARIEAPPAPADRPSLFINRREALSGSLSQREREEDWLVRSSPKQSEKSDGRSARREREPEGTP